MLRLHKTPFSDCRRLLSCAALMLALAALAFRAEGDDVGSMTAKVVHLSGPVRYTIHGAAWKMLNEGDVLMPGAIVQTAKENSLVDLQLGEAQPNEGKGSSRADKPGGQEPGANLVRLFANSAIELKKLSATGAGAQRVEEIELDLRAGQVLGAVKKLTEASRYVITAPSGAAGIEPGVPYSQGAVYVLHYAGGLKVLTGAMIMASVDAEANPHTQVVRAGYQFDPATGAVTNLPADAPERKLWPP